jgi:hypothetical protein
MIKFDASGKSKKDVNKKTIGRQFNCCHYTLIFHYLVRTESGHWLEPSNNNTELHNKLTHTLLVTKMRRKIGPINVPAKVT